MTMVGAAPTDDTHSSAFHGSLAMPKSLTTTARCLANRSNGASTAGLEQPDGTPGGNHGRRNDSDHP